MMQKCLEKYSVLLFPSQRCEKLGKIFDFIFVLQSIFKFHILFFCIPISFCDMLCNNLLERNSELLICGIQNMLIRSLIDNAFIY